MEKTQRKREKKQKIRNFSYESTAQKKSPKQSCVKYENKARKSALRLSGEKPNRAKWKRIRNQTEKISVLKVLHFKQTYASVNRLMGPSPPLRSQSASTVCRHFTERKWDDWDINCTSNHLCIWLNKQVINNNTSYEDIPSVWRRRRSSAAHFSLLLLNVTNAIAYFSTSSSNAANTSDNR